MDTLSNARIVICQPFLYRYSGSEIMTLELADAFASFGAEVTVVTWLSSELMRNEISQVRQARLLDARSEAAMADLAATQPNLIWSHQGFIPTSLLNSESRFIFTHLSSFNAFEFPFNPRIEKKLASRIYFVSGEARDIHLETGIYAGIDREIFHTLNNPAPRQFHEVERLYPCGRMKYPQTLLVVSNHVPPEVAEAVRSLRLSGIAVTVIGLPSSEIDSRQERVTAELVTKFDAVMTIGKTVQYALCTGTPVYCYDHFGGPGWLDEINFPLARYHNFSGRGFSNLSSQEIAYQVRSGFISAQQFVESRRDEFRSEFSYERIITDVAELLDEPVEPARGLTVADLISYAKAHEAVADFGISYYGTQPEIDRLRTELDRARDRASDIEARLTLETTRSMNLEMQIADITRTVSWRLTAPLRLIRRITRRH